MCSCSLCVCVCVCVVCGSFRLITGESNGIRTHTYIHTCTNIHAQTYTHKHACTHKHAYIHTHKHTYMHSYTYIHTYTCSLNEEQSDVTLAEVVQIPEGPMRDLSTARPSRLWGTTKASYCVLVCIRVCVYSCVCVCVFLDSTHFCG